MLRLYTVLYSNICCGYTAFDMTYVDRPVRIFRNELDLTLHVFLVSVQNKDSNVHRHRCHRSTAHTERPIALNNTKSPQNTGGNSASIKQTTASHVSFVFCVIPADIIGNKRTCQCTSSTKSR